ncbi:MAG: hypothetical protein SGARI_001497, partial [Bacillariaceae sp.]
SLQRIVSFLDAVSLYQLEHACPEPLRSVSGAETWRNLRVRRHVTSWRGGYLGGVLAGLTAKEEEWTGCTAEYDGSLDVKAGKDFVLHALHCENLLNRYAGSSVVTEPTRFWWHRQVGFCTAFARVSFDPPSSNNEALSFRDETLVASQQEEASAVVRRRTHQPQHSFVQMLQIDFEDLPQIAVAQLVMEYEVDDEYLNRNPGMIGLKLKIS